MYKVLIADDEELIGMCLEKMIDWASMGAEIVGIATDGEEALEIFHRESPDIAILDINMPFITGIEVARIISEERPQTKVIMLTAYRDFEYAHKAIKYHVTDYFTKPFDNKVIEESLRKVIEEIRANSTASGFGIRDQKKEENKKKPESITDRIFAYIKDNYKDPDLSLKKTAEALYISTSYLQTLLKNKGTNFSKLLNQVRMEMAMELLKEQKDVKIYEVAFAVGMNSSQYFSQKFKQYYGFEPKMITKSREQDEV